MSTTKKATFEVAGVGFTAEDDSTDDQILWVKADTFADVEQVIRGTGARILGIVASNEDIDFVLPDQTQALRQRLFSFCYALKARIEAAGYTICGSGQSWYALLPGHTEFMDSTDSGTHFQNYLGFFNSYNDLLIEVSETLPSAVELPPESEEDRNLNEQMTSAPQALAKPD